MSLVYGDAVPSESGWVSAKTLTEDINIT